MRKETAEARIASGVARLPQNAFRVEVQAMSRFICRRGNGRRAYSLGERRPQERVSLEAAQCRQNLLDLVIVNQVAGNVERRRPLIG